MKKSTKKINKHIEEEEDPLDRDLSDLIANGEWRPLSELFRYENKRKDKSITLRMPSDLLDQLKEIAKKEKTDYQKIIRQAIIEMLAKKAS